MIVNIVNNKKYIGSTVSSVGFNTRWSKHRSELDYERHGNPHLQLAWNKYGEHVFVFSILEKCLDEELVEKEQKWINYYKTMSNKNGYNLREAGNNGKLSAATKKKISKSKKGKTVGKENHFYGKHHTEETKRKIESFI